MISLAISSMALAKSSISPPFSAATIAVRAMTTLYKHQVFCLHGQTGQLAADAGAADTVITVDASVLADVTIVVGSTIRLTDGTNTSDVLSITAVDSGASTLTLSGAVGQNFLAATPTYVNRTPHAAYVWSESNALLTVCPEDPSHAIQAGSAAVIDSRAPTEAKIVQSTSGRDHPEAWGQRLDVAAGATGVIEYSWDYPVTVRSMNGYVEAANTADRYDVEAAPNTPVGFLTAAAGVGVTTLSVSGTVLANSRPSLLCRINEGATTDTLGRITAVDSAAGTITVQTPTVNSFTTAAVILVTNANTLDMPVPQTNTLVSVGGEELVGRDIPAGTVIRITYRNGGASPSSSVVVIKYLT